MSRPGPYRFVESENELVETTRTTTCTSGFKSHRGYPIERKAVNVMGRLGSLYDTSTDNLINRYSAPATKSRAPSKRVRCQVFSGDRSREPADVLQEIGYDDNIRDRILRQMVVPHGTSRLIEYRQPITQNTRFLYYCYRARKDKLRVEARRADRIVPPPQSPTRANYMITKILWGIEILCVIQLAENHSIRAVNKILRYIQNRLRNDVLPIQFNNTDRLVLDQLPNITVYGSETCIDEAYPPLLTVLNKISRWKENINFHQPLVYTMQPLRWLYGTQRFREPPTKSHAGEPQFDRAESILKRIDKQLKGLGEIFYNFPARFPSAILNQRLENFQQHYQLSLDTQKDIETRLHETISDVRRHQLEPTALDHIIEDPQYNCLHEGEIRQFEDHVQILLEKATFIEKLKSDRIEYINAFDVHSDDSNPMTNEKIDATLKRSYSQENAAIILWYSGDRLKREQVGKWKQVYQQLTTERHQAKQPVRLIYIDFTQCRQRLENFVIVRLPGKPRSDFIQERRSSRSKSAPISPVTQPQYRLPPQREKPSIPIPTRSSPHIVPERLPTSLPPPLIVTTPSRPSPPPTEINVLLLGETGVGKSTFINAFVNYLKFETLEQAERSQPVVLIPVSFLIITGDQFDEFTVRFGDVDPNEDHEHQGQSVTQHCKSYVFDLNDQLRLRLIDTPGIGDTRGMAQDVKNIDHILTYLNTLPHINAVCLLLKPNASRLNVFFRSCINQLLTYMTPVVFDNIIFCFTNSRATFYTPGDTGRLLKEMLNQEHLHDVPFQKQNTFCFDSESFRYLAARRCNIDFDDYQKVECGNSWTVSMKESIRLLKFIQARQPYALQVYQSSRKAALDITTFARPLMETLRLIIYNWKLTEARIVSNQMVLSSSPVTMEICTHCAQTKTVKVGPLWLIQYKPTSIKTIGNEHRLCPLDGNHFLIEAVIRHNYVSEGAGLRNEQWESSFHDFLLRCDRIHHFLRQQGAAVHEDPFGRIIDRFLGEEEQISQIHTIDSNMNRRVQKVLQSIKRIRQRNSQQLFDSNERLSLRHVYEILDGFARIPTVKVQIDDVKRSRESIMATNEHRIAANLIQNRRFD